MSNRSFDDKYFDGILNQVLTDIEEEEIKQMDMMRYIMRMALKTFLDITQTNIILGLPPKHLEKKK